MMFRDAEKAIEWLCSVFGFERHLVVPGEDGKIVHAQLVCGDAMIMLSDGSGHNEDNYGHLNRTPNEIEGLNTASFYMYIEKIDEHYEKVKSGGAETTRPVSSSTSRARRERSVLSTSLRTGRFFHTCPTGRR